jgi:hypothetical protein
MSQSIILDGHTLVANCAPDYDTMARSLLLRLQQLHERGPALKPGSHVDFGWSMLQIEAHPQHWVVCEPDYDSDPMIWLPKVDDTLWVLQQQAALLGSLDLASSLRTRGDQWLLLQPGALTAMEIYLHRSEPINEQDSGWYIGVETAEQNVERRALPVMAGTLIQNKPQWLSVLALPTGYLVHFERDRLVDIFDAEQRCVYPAT